MEGSYHDGTYWFHGPCWEEGEHQLREAMRLAEEARTKAIDEARAKDIAERFGFDSSAVEDIARKLETNAQIKTLRSWQDNPAHFSKK